MSSYYSCSPEDDFFESLDKALTNEYSSQTISNFIADLIVAINHLDDDPEEGFIFYDEEYNYSNCNSANDVSVDMFDDELCERYVYRAEDNLASGKESDNISVDMFEEFQNDVEVMDVESVCSENQNINERTFVVDLQNGNEIGSQELNIDEEGNVGEFPNDKEVVKNADVIETPNVSIPHTPCALSTDDDGQRLKESLSMYILLKQKSLPIEIKPIEVQNVETNRLSQSSDVLVSVSSEPNKNEGILNSESEKSQTVRQIVQQTRSESTNFQEIAPMKETSSRDSSLVSRFFIRPTANTSLQSSSFGGFSPVPTITYRTMSRQPIDCSSSIISGLSTLDTTICEDVHEISPTKRTSSQDGSLCDSSLFRRIFIPVNQSANTSMHSSTVRGFPLNFENPIDCSSRFGSGLNTTLCEEYETNNNFVSQVQRCSSRSTNFGGLTSDPSIRARAMYQNSVRRSFRNESDLNTTFCEEFETANGFVTQNGNESDLNTTLCEEYEAANSVVREMNARQFGDFNFEEAFSQCFFDSQNPAR